MGIKRTVKNSTKTVKKGVAKALRESRISEVVYETAKSFHAAGLMDKATMREFDVLCLPKVPSYTSRQIKTLRERYNCSQAVFAAYLNVSPSSLRQWETGAKKPAGIACKLLNIVETKGLEALT
jgi:putative transcriptional regulator